MNRRRKIEGQPEADFFRVAAWDKLGDNCQKYLAKGRKVVVVGSVSARAYSAQDGTPRASMDIYASDVEFLPAGQNSDGESVQPNMIPVDMDPDKLPF